MALVELAKPGANLFDLLEYQFQNAIFGKTFLQNAWYSKQCTIAAPSCPAGIHHIPQSPLHSIYCPKTLRSSAKQVSANPVFQRNLVPIKITISAPIKLSPSAPRHRSQLCSQKNANSLCCVKSNPYLFFSVTRCLEYLSSGEKRAGCADFVTSPETTFFNV